MGQGALRDSVRVQGVARSVRDSGGAHIGLEYAHVDGPKPLQAWRGLQPRADDSLGELRLGAGIVPTAAQSGPADARAGVRAGHLPPGALTPLRARAFRPAAS
eukprot:2721363-Prymnesium_polylepis.2